MAKWSRRHSPGPSSRSPTGTSTSTMPGSVHCPRWRPQPSRPRPPLSATTADSCTNATTSQWKSPAAASAALMGVPLADVAFIKNTTEGISLAAAGLDWKPGDRVIVPNYEFPSNIYPWIALRDQDVRVDVIEPIGPRRELPLELLADALQQAPTRVVAISWVQFGYGWRTDLAELGALCREHDALLCVDAIQGLGVLPANFEEWGVDVASADADKWLLGPHGIGIAAVSARAREQLRPQQPGWASVPYREEWDNLDLVFDESARRYEGGSPNVITTVGMGASIDLLLEAGIEAIWHHVDGLCQRLAAGLTEIGAELRSVHDSENRSAIVSFILPRPCDRHRRRGVGDARHPHTGPRRRRAPGTSRVQHGRRDRHHASRPSRNWPETRSEPGAEAAVVGCHDCWRLPDPAQPARRRGESNSRLGLCRPLPEPLGYAAGKGHLRWWPTQGPQPTHRHTIETRNDLGPIDGSRRLALPGSTPSPHGARRSRDRGTGDERSRSRSRHEERARPRGPGCPRPRAA